MTTVTLEHVTKTFRQHTADSSVEVVAVDDISMKFHNGEVTAILGPSGCGKSTLLRLAAGLDVPSAGRVLYDNVELSEIDMRDRGVGMVFQSGALMPHWEGWRTVGFFLRLRHREQEVPARVARVSKITGIGLEHLLARRPAQLSGGERQRVGIARALARDPRLFLFDEPFANIDAKMRAQARVELKRLLYEFPVTSIYVTHDQVEAVALADRIAVMRSGRIEQVGTYQQLYHSPANLFVGTFIGTPIMNTFKGYVRDGHWYGENFEGFPMRHDLPDGTPVTLGVRAEYIHLCAEGTYAVVDQKTPFFAERYQVLDVHLAGERWQMRLPLDERVEVGSTIRCCIDPAGLLFFDTKSGRRIG